MPVTVKLSRKFYDTFPDDVVNELVEWFNVIDATYHSDLRELNELNFGRFRAEMSRQLTALRADLDGRWERRFAALEAKLAELRADLIKWMFIFWATTALGVLGLTLRIH